MWQRLAGCILRPLKKLLGSVYSTFMMLILDDIVLVMDKAQIKEAAAIMMLHLMMMKCPMSWFQTILSQCFDWTGFEYDLETFQVGLTKKKKRKLATALLEMLECKTGKLDFLQLQKTTHRLSWWSRSCLWVRPFLKNSYAALSRVRRMMEKKAETRNAKVDDLLKTAWVHKYRVQADFPIWAYALTHCSMQQLPDERAPKYAGKQMRMLRPMRQVSEDGDRAASI